VIDEAFTRLEPLTSARKACELLGRARAALYRQRNPRPEPDRNPGPRAAHPAALSADEQEQLLTVLNAERFAGKSPARVRERRARAARPGPGPPRAGR
jgi:putative transposase